MIANPHIPAAVLWPTRFHGVRELLDCDRQGVPARLAVERGSVWVDQPDLLDVDLVESTSKQFVGYRLRKIFNGQAHVNSLSRSDIRGERTSDRTASRAHALEVIHTAFQHQDTAEHPVERLSQGVMIGCECFKVH
jgi:hypothetical protein